MTAARPRARLVGAALVLVAALAIGPARAPHAAGEGAEAVLLWRAGPDEAFRVVVPRAALVSFRDGRRAAARAEADAARAAGQSLLAAEIAAAAQALMREVPGFSEWAYGWVESYVIAYKAVGRAAGAFDGETGLAEAYRAAVGGIVGEQLRLSVLGPAATEARLTAAAERLQVLLETRRRSAQLAEEAAWGAFLASAGRVARLPAEAVPRDACPAPTLASLGAMPIADPSDAQLDLMVLRAARPFLGRAGLFALRLTVLGGSSGEVAGLVGALVQPSVAGFAALSGTTLALWAGDLALSRIDAALHRAEFEAQLAAGIAAWQADAVTRGMALVERALAEAPALCGPRDAA
jgi:hypothetical protein